MVTKWEKEGPDALPAVALNPDGPGGLTDVGFARTAETSSAVDLNGGDCSLMTLAPRPLAPYEAMPLPMLDEQQLGRIVQHHGLRLDGPIIPLHSSGVVHSLWALGSQLVLRVPKNEPMSLGDHRCESVAIPLALRAGVRTPDLMVFDDSLTILDVPYSIVERIDGHDLAAAPFEHPAFEDVGRELATLHAADLTSGRHPWLRDTSDLPAEAHFDEVVDAGLLHKDGINSLRSLCERLDSIIANGPTAPEVFIHDDIKPDNVMVDRMGRTHLIDWGDAGFGDPAHDFQSLPMKSIERTLIGYRSVNRDDPTLEARIVRRVVARSLSNLRRTPLAGPSWYRPIAANLTDLLTFAIDRRHVWDAWTH